MSQRPGGKRFFEVVACLLLVVYISSGVCISNVFLGNFICGEGTMQPRSAPARVRFRWEGTCWIEVRRVKGMVDVWWGVGCEVRGVRCEV